MSFIFLTGTMIYDDSTLGHLRNQSAKWQTIDVENRTPLIKQNGKIHTNFIDTPNYYSTIKFGVSRHGKEFLPYFDAQDVDIYFSTALSGLELFYYYTKGFGGFIRPRISTINYYEEIMKITQNGASTMK